MRGWIALGVLLTVLAQPVAGAAQNDPITTSKRSGATGSINENEEAIAKKKHDAECALHDVGENCGASPPPKTSASPANGQGKAQIPDYPEPLTPEQLVALKAWAQLDMCIRGALHCTPEMIAKALNEMQGLGTKPCVNPHAICGSPFAPDNTIISSTGKLIFPKGTKINAKGELVTPGNIHAGTVTSGGRATSDH